MHSDAILLTPRDNNDLTQAPSLLRIFLMTFPSSRDRLGASIPPDASGLLGRPLVTILSFKIEPSQLEIAINALLVITSGAVVGDCKVSPFTTLLTIRALQLEPLALIPAVSSTLRFSRFKPPEIALKNILVFSG